MEDEKEDLFDPTASEYDFEGGGKYDNLKKPGVYLLGCRQAIKHETSVNGKLYSKLAFVVLNGPEKSKSFVDRVFRSPSSYKRLAIICRAMRIKEKWNPNKGSEVERVMVGRTMKAKVTINEGGYPELAFPESEVAEDELATMIAWEAEFKKQAAKKVPKRIREDDYSDFGDDPGPSSSDDFGDDDIPF